MKTVIERLKNLDKSQLLELNSALHYFCPSGYCEDCPLYNGEIEPYKSGCLALQTTGVLMERYHDLTGRDLL